MIGPIVFIHRTPDTQLNSILETYALSINQLDGIVDRLNNYTTPIYSTTVANFTQLTPTATTPYLALELATHATTKRVLLNCSANIELAYTGAIAARPRITVSLVRKLQSAVSYNPLVDTVATTQYTSNNLYTGADSYYATAVFSGIIDIVAPQYYHYGLFVSYSVLAGSLTATNLDSNSNTASIIILQ